MTTEHLIGIGDDKPRETQATHCAQGQIYLRASAAEAAANQAAYLSGGDAWRIVRVRDLPLHVAAGEAA